MGIKKQLTATQQQALLSTLESRFTKNMKRHPQLEWEKVKAKLQTNAEKLWSLQQMESTGGEPDVISYNAKTDVYTFCDCSPETPAGRRSICYDRQALDARKEFKPANNAMDMAAEIGVEMLNEETYRVLQTLGPFDTKTSSWLQTPAPIRKLGGALFGDYRYGTVFIYHNGVQSYYAGRGFRGLLTV